MTPLSTQAWHGRFISIKAISMLLGGIDKMSVARLLITIDDPNRQTKSETNYIAIGARL